MYKLINGNLHKANDNDRISINGDEMVFYNLDRFLEKNPDIAKANGYYPLADVPMPTCEENEIAKATYTITGSKIVPTYTIETLPPNDSEVVE